jgi:transposase
VLGSVEHEPLLHRPDSARQPAQRRQQSPPLCPDLKPSFRQWAEHCQVAVVPARPYRPKHKANAEVAVQVVERWNLARLRHRTFFSLFIMLGSVVQAHP